MSGNEITQIDQLPTQKVQVLKAIKREGEKHLKYFADTMGAFKHPELRIKTFDTKYYEEALPIINQILNSKV